MAWVSVFCGVSVDGFIARPDGGLDFLDGASADQDGVTAETAAASDMGYGELVSRIDALVMGRATFDKVLTFGAWPFDKPVFVLTHRALDLPGGFTGHVETLQGEPKDVVAALEARGFHRLYVDGGRTVQEFLRASLVDELVVTRIPVLIGEGIPLFGPLPRDAHLRLTETRTYASGAVQERYVVRR